MACSPWLPVTVHPGFVATGIRFPDGAVTHTQLREQGQPQAGALQGWGPGWEWQWSEERQEEETKRKVTKITDSRPTIFILQDSNIRPWPKIAPFVPAPRNTKQEGAEHNASFMRAWRMLAGFSLYNP